MALTGHTAVIVGTQNRGSAVGTQKRWTPPSDVNLTAGVEAIVAELEVPDALSLFFDWNIKVASADGIEGARVLASQDGINFEEIWSDTFDPDTGPASPDNVHNFIAVTGWTFKFVQVRMTSKNGGGGSVVTVSVTESIFTSGILQFFDPSTGGAGSIENFNQRQLHIYSQAMVVDAQPVQSSDQQSDELVLGTEPRLINLEIGVMLANRTTLATLTIKPELFFGGQWWDLNTFTPSTGKHTVNVGFVWEFPGISGDFNVNTGLADITAEKIRFQYSGDVNDGDLSIFAVGKVPY